MLLKGRREARLTYTCCAWETPLKRHKHSSINVTLVWASFDHDITMSDVVITLGLKFILQHLEIEGIHHHSFLPGKEHRTVNTWRKRKLWGVIHISHDGSAGHGRIEDNLYLSLESSRSLLNT